MSGAEDRLAIALQLAARPDGCANGDFAQAAGLTSTTAGAYLNSWVKAGRLFRAAIDGQRLRFFDSAASAQAYQVRRQTTGPTETPVACDPVQLARRAVGYIKKGTIGSADLAKVCGASAPAIDAALAPLVVPGRLIRVPVLRRGESEFDYRLSAAWAPKDEDFAACALATAAPIPSISPVAPPSPKALSAPPSSRPQISTAERAQASRNGGASRVASLSLEQSQAAGNSLGWAPAAQIKTPSATTAPAQAPAAADPTQQTPAAQPEAGRLVRAVQALATQTGEDAGRILDWLCDGGLAQMALTYSRASQEVPGCSVIRVDDLVCAMNSRGELALDLDEARQMVFPPAQALYLKRFLVNTSVLEALDTKGLV